MPSPFRFTSPVDPTAASDQRAALQGELAGAFGASAPPPEFRLLSPAPGLLDATWGAVRASLVTGDAPRTAKELVAAGVARANRCAPCLDTHTRTLQAAGHPALARSVRTGGTPGDAAHARLLAWGAATATPGAAAPPAPAGHAPEYLATALVCHFLNRLATALLTGRAPRNGLLPRRRPAALPAGDRPPYTDAAPPRAALAALRAAVTADDHPSLTDAVRTRVRTTMAERGLRPPDTEPTNRDPLTRSWLYDALTGLRGADRPVAALALLTAFTPSQLTAGDVEFWRCTASGEASGDADLLRIAAFGAHAAVDRVEAHLAPAPCGRVLAGGPE
ncbi:alkyl hydroperoxide reductase AhpD [Streptomyces albospinus]|uniref:Alkyl hydroperoxide reductase AhpD n=1 Tax=Streptomyces albospinus TaxID=285515 RepID=A0ABQ2USW2_9ACTN|nr:carboxymuconolactone decarboxylase family protein [Streptomyces albospinus]GGU51261.1 alkyl hydroperoxide reductase AhpD [Streptomyces albospinus]